MKSARGRRIMIFSSWRAESLPMVWDPYRGWVPAIASTNRFFPHPRYGALETLSVGEPSARRSEKPFPPA